MAQSLEFDFTRGWRLIRDIFKVRGNGESPLFDDYHAVGDEILSGLEIGLVGFPAQQCPGIIIKFPSELPDLRRRFERLRHFLDNELTPELRSQIPD